MTFASTQSACLLQIAAVVFTPFSPKKKKAPLALGNNYNSAEHAALNTLTAQTVRRRLLELSNVTCCVTEGEATPDHKVITAEWVNQKSDVFVPSRQKASFVSLACVINIRFTDWWCRQEVHLVQPCCLC